MLLKNRGALRFNKSCSKPTLKCFFSDHVLGLVRLFLVFDFETGLLDSKLLFEDLISGSVLGPTPKTAAIRDKMLPIL